MVCRASWREQHDRLGKMIATEKNVPESDGANNPAPDIQKVNVLH